MKSYLFESLVRLLYPAECGVCQKPLTLREEILCADCQTGLDTIAWPMEQTLLNEPIEHLDHVWTVFAYKPPFRELLRSIKYQHKDYLLKAVRRPAATLAQALTTEFVYDALIPVPIDRRKYIQRHFNQAEVFARLLDPWVTPPVKANLLRKIFHVPSQTSLNREEREINVYGAFRVRDEKNIQNRAFLLIDDVFTTGATAREAARVLKNAGARRVDLLALACASREPARH